MPPKKTQDTPESVAGPTADELRIEQLQDDLEAANGTIALLRQEVSDIGTSLDAQKRLRATERETHQMELARAQDTINAQLTRVQTGIISKKAATPEEAVGNIIAFFAAVALGGPAASLRHAVHEIAEGLDREGKAKFREYAMRLRSAAEAAEQETATIGL
jgi:hypothetical protein